MIKHTGKHNSKKIVVMFHQVPSEDHMCLVVYSDLLPRLMHDEVMATLESPVGQQASNLAEVLHRKLMADGRNVLEVMHKEGFMKKVQTSQVIMTPTPTSSIRLDELNTILAEMAKGEEAVKRLKEIDESAGMQYKKKNTRDVGEPAIPALRASEDSVLTDEVIAAQQLAQANKMRSDARSLLAEADRLEKEAATLVPVVAPTVVKAKKTTKAKATVKNVNTEKTS